MTKKKYSITSILVGAAAILCLVALAVVPLLIHRADEENNVESDVELLDVDELKAAFANAAFSSSSTLDDGVSSAATTSGDEEYELLYDFYPPIRNSFVKERKAKLKVGETYDYTAPERVGFTFVGWDDGVTTRERKGDTITEDTVITAIYEYDFTENTPVIIINTPDLKPVLSKYDYTEASITMTNCSYRFEREEMPIQIKGRGNTSWTMQKRPFTIRFEEKINLLGTGDGPAKKWYLLPFHYDFSLLRTYAALYMGDLMPGIQYSSNMQVVELYMNGEYQGVYFVTEPIHFQESRLNIEEPIDDSSDEISFLVELDGRAPEEGKINKDYVYVNGLNYGLRSDVFSDAQIKFIKNKITELDEAVTAGNRKTIDKLLNIESAMDMYVLLEWFMCVDYGYASVFMYWNNEEQQFYFGCPWDFDLSSGNDYRLDEYDFDDLYVGKRPGVGSTSSILRRLTANNEWFVPETAERWLNIRAYAVQTMQEIIRVSAEYEDAIRRNFEQWPVFGRFLCFNSDAVLSLHSHEEQIDYLCYWLRERYNGLDEYFEEIRDEYGDRD